MKIFGCPKSSVRAAVGLALVALLVGTAACGSSSATTSSSPKYVIKYGGQLPADNPQGVAQIEFAKLVKQMTNGQVQVKNYFSGQLGTSASVNDQVRNGTIQMTNTGPSILTPLDPEIGVFAVPFLFSSSQSALAAARGPIGTQISDDFEKKSGMKILGWDEFGMAQLISRNPVRTIADLKGVKARSQANPYTQKPFSLIGAVPVPVDTTEIFASLSNHTIDADLLATASMFSNKDWEVVKNFTYVNALWYGNVILINAAFFHSLPANLQQAVQKAAQQPALNEVINTQKIEQTDVDTMKKNGVTVTTMASDQIAAWKAALSPMYDQANKDFGADIVSKLRS